MLLSLLHLALFPLAVPSVQDHHTSGYAINNICNRNNSSDFQIGRKLTRKQSSFLVYGEINVSSWHRDVWTVIITIKWWSCVTRQRTVNSKKEDEKKLRKFSVQKMKCEEIKKRYNDRFVEDIYHWVWKEERWIHDNTKVIRDENVNHKHIQKEVLGHLLSIISWTSINYTWMKMKHSRKHKQNEC